MEQLKDAEEKIMTLERQCQEVLRTQDSLRDEKEREVQRLEKKLEEQQRKLDQLEELKQLNKGLSKAMDEKEKQH